MTGCALGLILKVRVFGKRERPISLTWLSSNIVSFLLGGVYVRKLAPVRVSYRDDFLISYRVYKFACFSLSHEQNDNAILNCQKLRMRYPFQFTGRPISHRNKWSFRVYMIPLRKFVPEWNSRSITTAGVNSSRCDSGCHGILCCRSFVGAKVALVSCKHPPCRLIFLGGAFLVTYSERLATLEGLRKTQLKSVKYPQLQSAMWNLTRATIWCEALTFCSTFLQDCSHAGVAGLLIYLLKEQVNQALCVSSTLKH